MPSGFRRLHFGSLARAIGGGEPPSSLEPSGETRGAPGASSRRPAAVVVGILLAFATPLAATILLHWAVVVLGDAAAVRLVSAGRSVPDLAPPELEAVEPAAARAAALLTSDYYGISVERGPPTEVVKTVGRNADIVSVWGDVDRAGTLWALVDLTMLSGDTRDAAQLLELWLDLPSPHGDGNGLGDFPVSVELLRSLRIGRDEYYDIFDPRHVNASRLLATLGVYFLEPAVQALERGRVREAREAVRRAADLARDFNFDLQDLYAFRSAIDKIFLIEMFLTEEAIRDLDRRETNALIRWFYAGFDPSLDDARDSPVLVGLEAKGASTLRCERAYLDHLADFHALRRRLAAGEAGPADEFGGWRSFDRRVATRVAACRDRPLVAEWLVHLRTRAVRWFALAGGRALDAEAATPDDVAALAAFRAEAENVFRGVAFHRNRSLFDDVADARRKVDALFDRGGAIASAEP